MPKPSSFKNTTSTPSTLQKILLSLPSVSCFSSLQNQPTAPLPHPSEIMQNSCSASHPDTFPAGLRVLVVDDDLTWLKILEKMLCKCSYEVTTCGLARVALDMLRERKDRFDIVISDVNMPDMDGFKLLEQVGLEMDLPVIMMSVDGETSRVMKGVQHGACDYLLKPVRMKELKNIWQHVFRKKIHEVKEIGNHDDNEDNHMRNRLEEFDEKHILSGATSSARKRKDVDNKENIEQNYNDSASVKKARVVWSVDLHQKFVNAVDHMGFDKVGPKKILDLMNVPGLTRENVASHLQKYRLYLSRLQRQNEGGMFVGAEESDPRSRYPPGTFDLQSSMAMQKNNIPDSYELFATSIHPQHMIPEVCGDDLINTGSIQAMETALVLNNQNNQSQKMKNSPGFGVRTPSEEMIAGLDFKQNEICISKHRQSGYRGNQVMQFMKLMKEDQESITFMKQYSQLQHPGKHQDFGDDHLQIPTPIHSRASSGGNNSSPSCHIKPAGTYENNYPNNMPLKCSIDTACPLIEQGVTNTNHFEEASDTNSSSSPESYSSDNRNSISSWEPVPQKLNMKSEEDLTPSNDWIPCCLQSYGCLEDIELNGFGVFEYGNQRTADIQSFLYDELQYNCEDIFDSWEVPVIDYGLFT